MTDTFTIRSPWSFSLMQNYVQFNQYTADSPDINKNQKISEHSLNIHKAKKHLKGKPLEYYFATYILSNSYTNRDSSKDLITLYEKFKKDYPNSYYTPYLLPTLQPIIDFQNKIAESTINKKVKLIENYDNINTFGELVNTLRGKKVFVDIWGTWCPPCRQEIPSFVKLHDKYSQYGFQMVGLNQERGPSEEANINTVKEFVANNSVNYPCAMISEEVLAQLPEFQGFPTTLFIDHKGKVRMKSVGFHEYGFMAAAVETLLREQAAEQRANTN